MKGRQTLLCLSACLLLTGCFKKDSQYESLSLDTSVATETPQLLFKTHLTPSKTALHTLDAPLISETLIEKQTLIHYVAKKCEQAGAPKDIALIPLLTSLYNPKLEHNGSTGLWQINPVLAQNLSLPNNYWQDTRKDIAQSTQAVIAYITFLHTTLDHDWTLALAAYHAGLQPVLDALNHNKAQGLDTSLHTLNIEQSTKDFIHQLEAVALLAQSAPIDDAPNIHSIALPGQIELEQLAKTANIDYQALSFLNAGYKRPLTDPDGPHYILVNESDYPEVLKITKNLGLLRKISKSNWNHHVVKKNENLSTIAQNFETSVSEIKRVNHLSSDVIQVNQKLIIPDNSSKPQTNLHRTNKHPGPKRILHRVHQNETLYHISRQYHVSIKNIIDWNHLDGDTIQPEQVITVWQYSTTDSPKFYTVKSNDSLSKIAKAHHVSVSTLKEANHLDSEVIHPRDRLLIPSK